MPETFACPLCQGRTCDAVTDLRDRMMRTTDEEFQLVRCRSCGLLRLHPAPDEHTLVNSYAAGYLPHARPGLSGKAKGVLERRSVRLLQKYVGHPRRVLDVGCATGDLLAAVRAAGNRNVAGVEPGLEASQIARDRGLEVVTGDLDSAGFDSGSFDTVLVSHTLEHVRDPVAFMLEVQRILAPGGCVLLWLPNVDSIEARLLGHYWIGFDAPRHLSTFSVGTLGRTLATTGFHLEEVRHEAVGLEWAWGIRLLARDHLPGAEHALARLHPFLIVALSPLAMLGSRLRKSGRIRVIARKPDST
jgi:SAM-dependent methyltransferase